MGEWNSGVLIVSTRSLVAQSIVSLLEGNPDISSVHVLGSLPEALCYASVNLPVAVVLDLPGGADGLVERPLRIGNHEIRTIILREEDGNTRLYIHNPSQAANLANLLAAILPEVKRET